MVSRKTNTQYLSRNNIHLLMKFAGIAAVLCLLIVGYFSTTFPKVYDYYLEDNIIASFQYHEDVWDTDPTYFSELLNTTKTPLEYFASHFFNEVPTDILQNNFGVLIVQHNDEILPIYFFETNDRNYTYSTDFAHSFVDKWIIFCEKDEARENVKYYGDTSSVSYNKFLKHPNILINIQWENANNTDYIINSLSKYFPFDSNDNFFISVNNHSSQLVTQTSLWGDVKKGTITLYGKSLTGASHTIPESNTDNDLSYTLPFNPTTFSVSIDHPLRRFLSLNDNLNQLHHLYGLSLKNYINLGQYAEILLNDPIRRISLEFTSSIDTPLMILWIDNDYDYKKLLSLFYESHVEPREYTLPDGTNGKELIRTTQDLVFEENTFKSGDALYYFNVNDVGDTTRLIVSKNEIHMDEFESKSIANQDFMQFPLVINENLSISTEIETTTLFDSLNHIIQLKRHESTITN